jgi:hypothetical protein
MQDSDWLRLRRRMAKRARQLLPVICYKQVFPQRFYKQINFYGLAQMLVHACREAMLNVFFEDIGCHCYYRDSLLLFR